jgi:hypothetical protein
MRLRQHTLKQGGFTGTQKPSQDGCRNQSHGNTPKREVKQKSKQERSVPINEDHDFMDAVVSRLIPSRP